MQWGGGDDFRWGARGGGRYEGDKQGKIANEHRSDNLNRSDAIQLRVRADRTTVSDTTDSPAAAGHKAAKFTTGSTMRHVVTMTATGSVGLIAIFIVDALNLFYISLLGVEELAAAIGFAGTLMFFTISVSIGLTIATSALVSRTLGEGSRDEAARLGGASLVFMGLSSGIIAIAVWPFLSPLVGLLGATGETQALATRFLQIVIPSSPLVALGMGASGILRGVGDARRAMYVTLAGGLAAALLDPLLIFGLDLGLRAAISRCCRALCSSASDCTARRRHRLVRLPVWRGSVNRAALLRRPAGGHDPTRNTGRQCLRHRRNRAVRRRCGCRMGDYRRLIPVAFGVIFAVGLGRTDPRGELRCPAVRTAQHDHARPCSSPGLLPVCMGFAGFGRGWIADLFGATG